MSKRPLEKLGKITMLNMKEIGTKIEFQLEASLPLQECT